MHQDFYLAPDTDFCCVDQQKGLKKRTAEGDRSQRKRNSRGGWRFERERKRSHCASACAYACVAECVRSQARVSHHILTGLSGVPGVLHLPLSDHVTRSTNDNMPG